MYIEELKKKLGPCDEYAASLEYSEIVEGVSRDINYSVSYGIDIVEGENEETGEEISSFQIHAIKKIIPSDVMPRIEKILEEMMHNIYEYYDDADDFQKHFTPEREEDLQNEISKVISKFFIDKKIPWDYSKVVRSKSLTLKEAYQIIKGGN